MARKRGNTSDFLRHGRDEGRETIPTRLPKLAFERDLAALQ